MRSQLNNNNSSSYDNSNSNSNSNNNNNSHGQSNSGSGNTANRFNDYDDFSTGNGNGNGSGNGVFNSNSKNSIIDKNGNHRKNLFNDDGNEDKNKNQNTSNSVILTRGFGSEYPDNYIPPVELDPMKSSMKYPERKNSSRSVTGTTGHGNARETVISNFSSSSSSSKNNFNINGYKNNDDNRRFERNSNDEYDDDNDFNIEEKPKNNYYNRENRQNNPRTEMFSDNSDTHTNSRSNTVIGNDTDLGELRECPSCSRKFNPKPYEKHILVCAKINSKRKVFDSLKMRVEGNPELAQILNKKMKEESKKKAIENRRSVKIGGGGERGELGGQTFRPGQAQEYDSFSRERGGGERGFDRGGDRGGGGGGHDRDGGFQADLLQHSASAAASKKSKWQAESNAFRASMRAARQVTHAIATGAPLPPPVASAPDPSLVQCPHCSRRYVSPILYSSFILFFIVFFCLVFSFLPSSLFL